MIEKFLRYLENQKRYSKNTIEAYRKDLEDFYLFCNTDYSQIIENHNLIRNWIIELSQKGLNKKSINRKISALRSFYKYLMKNQIIEKNPTDKIFILKIEKKLPEFIPQNDFDKLKKELFPQNFKGLRDRLIVELLYQTGIRRQELLNLKVDDIDFARRVIKVYGKRNKTRLVPMTDSLMALIDEYLLEREKIAQTPYLIITNSGNQAYPNLIYRTVKRVLGYITNIKKRSPHILRHSIATHLMNNGSDINAIKEFLGHSNLSATQIYTHTSVKELTKIYKLAHPRA